MPNERDSFSVLTVRDYDIAGNLLRAYSDANGKIVFVLDLNIDENKPNALLVIDAVDNRKWDDILENDYGVELETVRPKKDNKYQKLDIEYSGLELYRGLIDKYLAGEDINDVAQNINEFRKIAVRRAATERLMTAETTADNARETIEKTNDTIAELNARVRVLRGKLAELRKNIGKEPTKQSASKILRAESQIDATNEKIKRAKKRLDNAQKRLVAATDDAEIAREILSRIGDTNSVNTFYPLVSEDIKQTTNNTKAEDMADEDIKPLFDTDPENLDDEIAFKPVEFSAPVVAPDMVPAVQTEPEVPANTYGDAPVIAPLTFTPPVIDEQYSETDEALLPSQVANPAPAPVLDSITAVETPAGLDVVEKQSEFIPQPITPSYAAPAMEPVVDSDVAPAPMESGFRPVSPLTGVAPVADPDDGSKRKQGVVYYAMLIALIALSVFVLWFYQKQTGGNTLPSIEDNVVPEITQPTEDVQTDDAVAVVVPVVEEVVVTENITPEPVVEEKTVVEEVVVPVVEPVVEQPEPMPEPIVVEAEQEPVEPTEIVVPVTVPVINTVPTVVPEPETIKVETEEEILSKKPEYGVSQNNKMFVADDEFETDRLGADVIADDDIVIDTYDTPIVRPQDAMPVVQYQEPQIVSEYTDEEEVPMCEGGASPDRFGCCPGETYTQIDNGGFACCPDAGGNCFPPLY